MFWVDMLGLKESAQHSVYLHHVGLGTFNKLLGMDWGFVSSYIPKTH